MPAKVQLEGLSELRDALRALPADLAQEGSAIVLAHAETARQQIVDGYPEGPTGNLKAGVTVERNESKYGSAALVRSRARHAHLFEYGTRRRTTDKGWNRGTMPQAPEPERMIPKVVRLRRRMVRQLIALVRRAGFVVQDEA